MVEKFFRIWSPIVLSHPRIVALCTLVVLGIFGLSISHLRFETDFNAMIPTASGAVLEKVARSFGMREQSFLILESPRQGDGPALVAFARAFAAALEGNALIARVSYGFEEMRTALLGKLLPYAPRYASPGDEAAVERLLGPEDLDGRIARQMARLSFPGMGGELLTLVEQDPFDLGAFLWPRLAAMKGTYRFDPASPHCISEDGRAILIRIQGSKPVDDMASARATAGAIDLAVERAREATGSKDFTVRAGGAHFLAREAESVVRGDLIRTMSLSTALVLIFIAWILRRLLAGLLVLPPLLIGLVGGLGVFGLFRSSISTLSMASASIQVGLGVDFAIHLMQASIAERAAGHSPRESVERALKETGPSLFYAAMTTIVAFLAFPASRFEFLAEMGLLTGFGVLISLIATVTVLPPILCIWLAGRRETGKRPRSLGVLAIVGAMVRRPALSLAALLTLVAAAGCYLVLRPPALEMDLRNIHARDSAALAAERRLEEVFGGSQEPLLLLLDAEAAGLEDRLRRLQGPLDALVAGGTLAAHVSAAALLPSLEAEARAIGRLSSLDPEDLRRRLAVTLDRAGIDPEAVGSATSGLVAAAADRRPLTLDGLRELGLGGILDPLVRPDADRPGRVLGLVMLFPSQGLWSPERRAENLRKVQGAIGAAGVQASLTGLAVISAEAAGLVVSEMVSIGGLTAITIGILVALQFRRPLTFVLACIPVTIGCLWTAALMGLFGYRLHFMNASVLPMVLGIGIDSGTHLLHRYGLIRRHGGQASGAGIIRETFSVTGSASALSSITIMMSFGSLAFSSNRGLSSVGMLSLIGVGASLLASLTFLPAVLAAAQKAPRCRGARIMDHRP